MNRIDPTVDVLLPDATRALVVADDPLVRQGLTIRLGLAVVGEAATGDDVADTVLRVGANVVLWDLGPSTRAKLEVGALAHRVSVPVVALASDGVRRRDLLGAGVAGVIGRETGGPALASALGCVRHGLRVSDADLEDELDAAAVVDPPVVLHADVLTAREHEVVELMAEGLSNKQIADRLGISSHTAKFHVNAVLGKLDASTRTEAVVRAVQRGVVML